MNAIRSRNKAKDLIFILSIVLFLFVYVDDLFSMENLNTSTGADINNQVPESLLSNSNYNNNNILQIREMQMFLNETNNPGSINVAFNAANLSDGMYFCVVLANSTADVKKMTLVN
jgi:hypothetical protein